MLLQNYKNNLLKINQLQQRQVRKCFKNEQRDECCYFNFCCEFMNWFSLLLLLFVFQLIIIQLQFIMLQFEWINNTMNNNLQGINMNKQYNTRIHEMNEQRKSNKRAQQFRTSNYISNLNIHSPNSSFRLLFFSFSLSTICYLIFLLIFFSICITLSQQIFDWVCCSKNSNLYWLGSLAILE